MRSRVVGLVAVALLHVALTQASAQPNAYVTNFSGNDVTVIDTATNTIVATIPVGSVPVGVAVNATATRVYVANQGSGNVSVINTATNTVINTVTVGNLPWGVAVNPAGTRVFVTNAGDASVTVIDAVANTVLATIPVDSSPNGVAVNAVGSRAYVTNNGSSTVSVIDTAASTVIATVTVGVAPLGVVVTGTRVYVNNQGSGNVSVIDTTTNAVIATVTTGFQPYGVAVNPAGTGIYVVNNAGDSVSVIATATNTVLATINVSGGPAGVSVTPDGLRAYVAEFNFGNVAVIDTGTNAIVATVVAGFNPIAFGVFIPPAAVSPVQTPTVSQWVRFGPPADFAVGSGPAAVAAGLLDGDANVDLVVANANSNTISVLFGDGAGGFGSPLTLAVGGVAPVAVAVGRATFFSTSNDIVTANQGSDSVTVFRGDGAGGFTLIGQFAVGAGPRAVLIADVNGDHIPDIVTANAASVTVLLGTGAGTFIRVDTPVTGVPTSIALGDFDGNSTADLAVAREDGTVLLLLGNGNGTFTTGATVAMGIGPAVSIAIVDVNGDDFPDLVAALRFFLPGVGAVAVRLNDGSGGFLPPTYVPVGAEPTGVVVADFNFDGRPDLAVSNTGSSFMTFLAGDGSGAFPERFDVTVGAGPAAPVVVADLDNDGALDVAVVRPGGNAVTILLNKSQADVAVAVGSTGTAGPGAAAFKITVSNAGPAPAENVTVTDVTPPGTTFASIAFTAGPGVVGVSCLTPPVGGTGSVVCTIDTLPAGSTVTFVLTLIVGPGAGELISSTATAFATTHDPDLTNNTATSPFPVGAPTLAEWAQLLLAGVLVATAVLTLRRRTRSRAAAGIVVLGLALSAAQPAGAETIGGFCRQAGTFEIRAFSLNTATGATQMLAAPSLGVDRAGHFASATDITASSLGTRMVVGRSSQTPGLLAVESLIAVNTSTNTVQASSGTLPGANFAGQAMSTLVDVASFSVLAAQRGPTQSAQPSTDVFQIDVATAAVGPQANAVFTAAVRPHYATEAQPFNDQGIPTPISYLLQPCDLPAFQQELVTIDRNTPTWVLSTAQLNTTTCLQAPGLLSGVFYALTNQGVAGIQLVTFDSLGSVTTLPPILPGWRPAAAAPYVYSRVTKKLYVLDDTQTQLATYNLLGVAATLTPVTKPPACGDASITTFAGILP